MATIFYGVFNLTHLHFPLNVFTIININYTSNVMYSSFKHIQLTKHDNWCSVFIKLHYTGNKPKLMDCDLGIEKKNYKNHGIRYYANECCR